MTPTSERDDGLTLVLDRVIAAPRRAVWRCWSEAALFRQWFCPRPWSVPEADLDLRPGGRMNIVMAGPAGERVASQGCYLEVVPERRLIFTDSFAEGFRPLPEPFMTGFVELSEAPDDATRLVWGARHATAESVRRHRDMGFEAGWNAAAAQLEGLAQSLPAQAAGERTGPPFKAKTRTCLFLHDEAEAAARFYVSLLPDSEIGAVYRPDPEGPPLVVEFSLAGTPFMTLNGNPEPIASHTTSISILTKDQAETDRLWRALCADGGEEGRCGWLKDRFGVYWQIVPEALPRLMRGGDPAASARVSAALMQMRKIDIAGLEAARAAS